MGRTSPNKRIRKVTSTTSIKNFVISEKLLKRTSPSPVKINTIKMFIKLLVIKIVANNFLGLSSNLTILLSPLNFSESLFKSVCEIEKKAISVPEIKAEHTSNNKRIIEFTSISQSKFKIIEDKISGSGSNF